jgi:hypothetical protein
MHDLMHKLGLRLSQIPYFRSAIDERADLSGLKDRPRMRIFFGVCLIALSFALCWPVIGALGTLSVYYRQPLIVVILGPIVYGITHCCFLAGMALAGEKYVRILVRWAVRVGFEKMVVPSRNQNDETRIPESMTEWRMTE